MIKTSDLDAEIKRLREERLAFATESAEKDAVIESLRTRLTTAREALTRIASDFEADFVLDGVVVDDPYRMHQVAWEVAKAALAATDDRKEDVSAKPQTICSKTNRHGGWAKCVLPEGHLGRHEDSVGCWWN